MARIASVFGSLPPLIPAPVAPPATMTIPDGPLARMPQIQTPRVMYDPQGDFSDAPVLPKVNLPSKAPRVMAHVPQANVQLTSDPLQRIAGHAQNKLEADERRDAYKPATFGEKLAHALSKIGNVAGDIVAPNVMARIPGTDLNREVDESNQANAIKTAGDAEAENAQKAALAKEEEAQAGLAGAQAGEAGARTNLTNAQANLYGEAAQAMKDPKISGAFTTLADPKATPEARRTAMATIAQSPIAMLPMLRGELSGAENLYREGETGSRIGGKNLIPDANSPTGYSTMLYDRFGNPTGQTVPVEPTSGGLLAMGPQGGSYIDTQVQLAGGKAAATQAQGLIPIYDPNTNDVIGYMSKGNVANATGAGKTGTEHAAAGGLTPKPGTTVTEQAQNAVSLKNMISENILPSINEAARAGDMGPASGRVQEFLLKHIGNPDSAAAKLQAQLSAVPMMLGRMYGYRSAEYLQGMEGFMNTRMTPEALKAYLGGVTTHAQTIANQGGMGENLGHEPHPESHPAGLPGTGKVFDSAKWAKANPNGDVNAAKAYAKSQGYEVK